MRWYADNSELNGIREARIPDILLFGGYAIEGGQEIAVRESVEDVRERNFGSRRAPVKWNFKDLKSHYEKQGQMELYERILHSSKEWRSEIMETIKKYDIKIIMSCLQTYSIRREVIKDLKEELSGYAFSNALMRFAICVKKSGASHAEVILDWPDKGVARPFNREYAYAFNTGKSEKGIPYYSGPLRNIGFSDSIRYASMNHTTLLQVADIILGATREFLECALEKKAAGIGVESIISLRCCFLGWPSNVFGRGISVCGDDKFKETVRQYLDDAFSGRLTTDES